MRVSSFAIAITMGLALAGCGGSTPANRTLYSTNQPVVTRDNLVIDLAIDPSQGINGADQRRAAEWFDVLDLGYGDRVALDFGGMQPNGITRSRIAALAAVHGLTLNDTAPVTPGNVGPGMVRVVVTRSTASVPNCPNWSKSRESNFNGSNHSNYGCATNSTMAAMIADPEDLVRGSDEARGNLERGTKAVEAYRAKKATTGK